MKRKRTLSVVAPISAPIASRQEAKTTPRTRRMRVQFTEAHLEYFDCTLLLSEDEIGMIKAGRLPQSVLKDLPTRPVMRGPIMPSTAPKIRKLGWNDYIGDLKVTRAKPDAKRPAVFFDLLGNATVYPEIDPVADMQHGLALRRAANLIFKEDSQE